MSVDFEFVIGSPYDKEKLICEIYYKNVCIAEISQETSELILEIYPMSSQEYLSVPLVKFQEAIEKAKRHLMGNG